MKKGGCCCPWEEQDTGGRRKGRRIPSKTISVPPQKALQNRLHQPWAQERHVGKRRRMGEGSEGPTKSFATHDITLNPSPPQVKGHHCSNCCSVTIVLLLTISLFSTSCGGVPVTKLPFVRSHRSKTTFQDNVNNRMITVSYPSKNYKHRPHRGSGGSGDVFLIPSDIVDHDGRRKHNNYFNDNNIYPPFISSYSSSSSSSNKIPAASNLRDYFAGENPKSIVINESNYKRKRSSSAMGSSSGNRRNELGVRSDLKRLNLTISLIH